MKARSRSAARQRTCLPSSEPNKPPPPPAAERREQTSERFGRTLTDPYAWLRDPDWKRVMREPEALDADIRAYLEAENAWGGEILAPVTELRERLTAELRARIKEDDSSVPSKDGGWAYFRRFVPEGQYPLFCREKPEGGSEQILLDGNAEAEGESFFAVNGATHSPDHRYFAAAIDRNGSEYCTVEIREAATGKIVDTAVSSSQGDLAFSDDSRFLFYTWLDDNHRPVKIFRHEIGTASEQDTLIYEETDPGFFISVGKTESGRFIVIDSHDHSDTTEVRLIPADAPESEPRLIWARQTGVTCDVSDHGENLFILTNEGDDVDFRISEAPLDDPSPENWQTIVPHRDGRLIRSMLAFESYLVRLERENALPRIVIRDLSDGSEHEIAFEEEAYELSLIPGYEFETTTLRFSYASPTTPSRVYDYDMASRERTLRKEQEVPSGHNPEDYVCRRLLAESHDGVLVPVTVLHRKQTLIDGGAPMLLYGYGSYGYSMPAGFSTNILSLVDRGFVYAIAHIRGGTECGKRWYLGGKLQNKPNTFKDFIAAAEMLIRENYTTKGNIVAQGRSAGGMLMGAVANMRPDLFRGIVAEVPFIDVINTMSDETLPLTPPEWVEWGDPIRDEAAFKSMSSYCPYTNITDQPYPNVLATGGLTDPRVTYWEPAKWVAKLRHHNTGDSKIVLWINMDAGHGGASGRFDRLSEVALSWAFALMITGKTES